MVGLTLLLYLFNNVKVLTMDIFPASLEDNLLPTNNGLGAATLSKYIFGVVG